MSIKYRAVPPTDALPKGAHALIQEMHTLQAQRRTAIAHTLELQPNTSTGGLDDQAKRADAQAVAEQTRKGGAATNPAEHQDALAARREAADRQVASLTIAIAAVDADLDEWVQTHRAEIIKHQDERLAAAADNLNEMLASIAPARAAYDTARAARAWTDQTATDSIVSWIVRGSDGPPQREYADPNVRVQHGSNPI